MASSVCFRPPAAYTVLSPRRDACTCACAWLPQVPLLPLVDCTSPLDVLLGGDLSWFATLLGITSECKKLDVCLSGPSRFEALFGLSSWLQPTLLSVRLRAPGDGRASRCSFAMPVFHLRLVTTLLLTGACAFSPCFLSG